MRDSLKQFIAHAAHSRSLIWKFVLYRHPKTSLRPKFSVLQKQLFLPGNELLKWLEDDEAVHPEAAQLGADILCGEELYKDLQTLYMESEQN